jgi:hemerythrin-like domain-containing protein
VTDRSDANKLSDDRGLRMRMRSEERRISSQHKQLGDLYERVLASVAGGSPRKAIGDFLLFATALEAHMSVEEEIYFPALHGLRNDVGAELVELVTEHQQIRASLPPIQERLAADDRALALAALDALADRVERHEQVEESLLARITEGPITSFGHSILENGN